MKSMLRTKLTLTKHNKEEEIQKLILVLLIKQLFPKILMLEVKSFPKIESVRKKKDLKMAIQLKKIVQKD